MIQKHPGIYYILFILTSLYCCNAPATHRDKGREQNGIVRYKGLLPCADCPGIVAEITLDNDSLKYTEKDIYIDRPDTLNQIGYYIHSRVNNSNEIILDYKTRSRKYLELNDSTLLMLSADDSIIDTVLQLHRIN